jgi:hypothetical protein
VSTVTATVAATSPLSIYMDGDETNKVPALKLGSYTPTVGDRVRVEARPGGLVPIVQEKLT